MTKKIIIAGLAMVIIAAFVMPGCKKDTTVIIPLRPPTITDTISFKNDLVPIFKGNCALSGCHASGAHAPDLTAANAYKSLTAKFISKSDPESSIIYERLIGKLSPAMPLGAASNPSNIEGQLLAWIKQGAKDN